MQKGNKEIRRNEIYLANEKGDEYAKYISTNTNLIVRSMLEDDVDYVSEQRKIGWRQRKRLMKLLKQQDSEAHYFVIEEQMQYEGTKNKIIAIAELYQNGNIDVWIFIDKNLANPIYDFAIKTLKTRIHIAISELFHKTNNTKALIYLNKAV